MARYGEADGGGSCAGDFGNELVRRWRATRKRVCSSTDDNANVAESMAPGMQTLHSQIDCHLVRQTRHHGNGDNLCVMRNVAVDMALFGRNEITSEVISAYVKTRHARQPYLYFPPGFIQASCTADRSRSAWHGVAMPGWNAALTVDAVQFVDSQQAVQCDEWIDHKVLITQRDTFANFFHDSEDFVNVFLAMSILEWSSADTQMFLTDLYPQGPFW
jgi:hypothetical protein